MSRFCPALFIAAPSSNQGKTTVTCAIARKLTNEGKKVRIFKTGPDYLDPQILQQASRAPVIQLDLWMCGLEYCEQALYDAAADADLILIEGAMGLFDGQPSSADLAKQFNIPIAVIMDVKGAAQTVGAVLLGLKTYRDDISITHFIANNCGSNRHKELIEEAMPADIKFWFNLARDEKIALPERHLGLVQAEEVTEQLEEQFNYTADKIIADEHLLNSIELVEFKDPKIEAPIIKPLLKNKTIAIAKDVAFNFIYEANVQTLKDLGAKVVFFSPLKDKQLPSCDSIWLPGGYPELHAKQISENTSLIQDIQTHFKNNKKIFAECGGFMTCLESLTDLEGHTYPMFNLIEGQASMRGKRGCQGMQFLTIPFTDEHGKVEELEIKGHAHHRSRADNTPEPISFARRQRHPAPGEAIFKVDGLIASYLHVFFRSNLEMTGKLFK
ncbi:MAG: cobyrinate a,c-diamide synthase [Saccharospirillaceae bacterium]|nr:cobyrinate a,c-diamide synthase [Pseudomonadales bacterium]NRB77780.1 cobyrinate a,c-diamide synthase [Saccharospirillaceae bacterium]